MTMKLFMPCYVLITKVDYEITMNHSINSDRSSFHLTYNIFVFTCDNISF